MNRWIKFLFCALPCFAQVDSGAITGVVSDRSGAVVPGVKVQIVQIETNSLTALQTNDAGFYSAPSLRPGFCAKLPGLRQHLRNPEKRAAQILLMPDNGQLKC